MSGSSDGLIGENSVQLPRLEEEITNPTDFKECHYETQRVFLLAASPAQRTTGIFWGKSLTSDLGIYWRIPESCPQTVGTESCTELIVNVSYVPDYPGMV